MTGTVSARLLSITEKSGTMDQFTDVIITPPSHNQAVKYDSTNWVNSSMTLEELIDMTLSSPSHDDILVWDESLVTWKNAKITSLLSQLETIVNGIVSIKLSVFIGEEGNSSKALAVAFTDIAPNSGFTMALGSCGDNNVIFKKSPSESSFSFLATLNKGHILNLSLEAGTVFRSDKGISGFSTPFPMPFGISNFSDVYFRFYAMRNSNVVHATSAGRDSLVTMYASDETTIVDGPNFISAYGSTVLTCNANTEFVVKATTDIFCGTKGDRGDNVGINSRYIDMRLVPPMSTEIIVHSRNNRISAQFSNTSVVYHRRNMTTGSFTVQAGTPLNISGATGGQQDYNPNGWLILRSDKPIASFSGADSAGWMATPGWPLTALAQLFPIISTIGTNTDSGWASISLASPNEGSAGVYDESGTLLATFAITRGASPPTTVADQLFPASGQFNPGTSLGASLTSGYVECTVPCVCIMNFDGSSVFTYDAGDEVAIPGSTPDEIRAQIRKDTDGFLRRRSIDTSGNETWVIC